MASERASEWVIPVGVVALGYYVVSQLFGSDAPPDPSHGGGGHVDAGDEDARPATFSESQAVTYADAIFQALRFFTEDEGAVVRTMLRAEVDADVRLLINAYGSRALNFGYLNRLTLPEAITAYLSASDIAAINDGYRAKGINFQF